MAKTIAVIGIGQMGTALALTAAANGCALRMVGTPVDAEVVEECRRSGRHPRLGREFPEGTRFYTVDSWREAVVGADFVIGAISSFGVEWFLDEILSNLGPEVPVLSAAKGLADLDDGSLISYPRYWEERLAERGIERDVYALGGPGTAADIMDRDHTHVAICGHDAAVMNLMKEALQTPWFHISLTTDTDGLESAVALKNAYALGVAMAIGYSRKSDGDTPREHYNSQAAVFYQATKEMYRLLRILDADEESILIGIGDLYVTVSGARTRKIGILLGEGKSLEEAQKILGGMTLESIVIVRRLARALEIHERQGLMSMRDFPLLSHVISVLDSGVSRDLPWERFTYDNSF